MTSHKSSVPHIGFDRFIPLDWGRRLAADIPGARLETVPACGHFVPEERPDVVVEKALELFAD